MQKNTKEIQSKWLQVVVFRAILLKNYTPKHLIIIIPIKPGNNTCITSKNLIIIITKKRKNNNNTHLILSLFQHSEVHTQPFDTEHTMAMRNLRVKDLLKAHWTASEKACTHTPCYKLSSVTTRPPCPTIKPCGSRVN